MNSQHSFTSESQLRGFKEQPILETDGIFNIKTKNINKRNLDNVEDAYE